jgi:hypothetical protein
MRAIDSARIRGAVVDLALGDAAVAGRGMAALEAGSPSDWETAISLAAAWGVLYPVRRYLDEERMDDAGRTALRQASMALAARTTFVLHRSVAALHILEDADVPYVAIKGVGLIAALERPPATRATSDLDILVREDDADKARHALMAAGYHEINPDFVQHMSDIAHSGQLHNYARALKRDDFEVDLHWRMGPNPPDGLLSDGLIGRAQLAACVGSTIVVADPVDGVLINAHHALRGSFDLHNTVRDLCDLRLWWEFGPISDRLDETISAAIQSNLGPALLALWRAILARDPAHPLRAGADHLAAAIHSTSRVEASLMQQYIDEQILHGKPAQFTLELFNPKLYLRALFARLGEALRDLPQSETAMPDDAYRNTPRPLGARLMALPTRIFRVLREVARVSAVPAYRAVARAQRRFH